MLQGNRSEAGFAMLSALFLSMAAAGVVLVMSVTSMVTHRDSQQRLRSLQARYLAEGSIEIAKQSIQSAISQGGVPTATGTAVIDGVSVPYSITATSPPIVQTDSSGVQTTVQSYEVVGTASVQGVRNRANRIVNARWTPLFQYAVFSEQSLDILPGPDMTIIGRIHTNGDLRLGCLSGTLTLDTNHIRVVGEFRRWYKHNDTPTLGTIRARNWVANPFDPGEPVAYANLESYSQMTALGIPSATGYDSKFDGYDANGDGVYEPSLGDWLPFNAGLLDRYGPPPAYPGSGNTLLLGAHGVTRVMPPSIGSIAMYEPDAGGDYELNPWGEYVPAAPGTGTHRRGFFHDSADLTIIVSADGMSWDAYDSNGVDVAAAVAGAVTLDQTYDKRQGGYLPVAKVDVGALNASTTFPANGLLYVSHYGMGTGTDSKGVHLANGANLAADLTVVTEGSAYIQGDFNTTSSTTSASVFADAVNLLSNSWVNTTSKPIASNTTYNVAVVAGNTETVPGAYNGGLENFPRFHENWSGKTCTLVGSMVTSWDNQFATGSMSDAQYSPPIRNFGYDTRFNDVGNVPPFTPMTTSVVDIARW